MKRNLTPAYINKIRAIEAPRGYMMKKSTVIFTALLVIIAFVIAFFAGYRQGAGETIQSAELLDASSDYQIYYKNLDRVDLYTAD